MNKGRFSPRRVIDFLFSADRAVYLFLLAIPVLFISAMSHWYYVPVWESGRGQWLESSLSFGEALARLLMLLTALAVPYFCLRKPIVSRFFQRVCWSLLILVAFFPFYISHWQPEQFMAGNIIHQELERVSADMEANMVHQQRDWRYWQEMDSSVFGNYKGVTIPEKDGWAMSYLYPSAHQYIFQQIFSYSNDFLNVVSRGWVFAGSGLIILLIAMSLVPVSPGAGRFPNVIFICGITVFFVVLLVMPRAISEYQLQKAEHYAAQGNTSQAIELYRSAVDWKPSLRFSLDYYHSSLGVLLNKRGCNYCYETLMMRFAEYIGKGKTTQARITLSLIEQMYPRRSEVAFWFDALNNRMAIEAFNLGQYSLAAEYWESSRQFVPFNPVSHYGLALVNVKLKRFSQASESLEKLVTLQEYLTFKRLTIKGQYIVMQGWSAYWNDDYHNAFQLYSLGLTPEVW